MVVNISRQHINNTAVISSVCTSLPLEGLPSRKQACKGVIDPVHRNEIVAGGMSDHLTHAYKAAMDAVAYRAGDFFEASTIHRTYGRLSISSFLSDPLHQIQITPDRIHSTCSPTPSIHPPVRYFTDTHHANYPVLYTHPLQLFRRNKLHRRQTLESPASENYTRLEI